MRAVAIREYIQNIVELIQNNTISCVFDSYCDSSLVFKKKSVTVSYG